jgi:uncharacterized YccA/Bax inhibitor family protein
MAAASSNPAFRNSPAFNGAIKPDAIFTPSASELNEQFGRPSATPADTGRMTYEDTINKILISFAILAVGAVVGWLIPILFLPAAIVGLVLGLVNTFKKMPSRGLILTYAAVEGVFVGGLSNFFNGFYEGIVPQAVFGTLGVVAVTLFLFKSGRVRESKRATQIFLVAMIGYAAFSLINVVLMVTGVTSGMFGLRSFEIFGIPLGAIIGVFVIIMAAYSLVLDFTQVKNGVERGAPRIFGWQAAFGIMVTVVWLYVEILRLIAIFRSN